MLLNSSAPISSNFTVPPICSFKYASHFGLPSKSDTNSSRSSNVNFSKRAPALVGETGERFRRLTSSSSCTKRSCTSPATFYESKNVRSERRCVIVSPFFRGCVSLYLSVSPFLCLFLSLSLYLYLYLYLSLCSHRHSSKLPLYVACSRCQDTLGHAAMHVLRCASCCAFSNSCLILLESSVK